MHAFCDFRLITCQSITHDLLVTCFSHMSPMGYAQENAQTCCNNLFRFAKKVAAILRCNLEFVSMMFTSVLGPEKLLATSHLFEQGFRDRVCMNNTVLTILVKLVSSITFYTCSNILRQLLFVHQSVTIDFEQCC